jgi:hypothetical protein
LKLIGNIVFFHLAPQGAAVDIKGRGGFTFIPVVFSQRVKNEGFLAEFNFSIKRSFLFLRQRG